MIESTELLLEGKGLACCKNESVLFTGLDLALSGGEILQIDGVNGSGKTSLLRILCGLAQADAGEVTWHGRRIDIHRSEYLQEVIYIAHSNGIKVDLTSLENLTLASALCMKTSKRTLKEILSLVGLLDYAEQTASNMSSGQKRRLALARLLISDARLWILDEPFTSLDEDGKELVSKMIIRHVDDDGCVILTSHETVYWLDQEVKTIELK